MLLHFKCANCILQSVKGSLEPFDVTPPPTRSSSPHHARAPKRKISYGETEETVNLSTTELQRLVLLEQLKYTRMKIRRMESQDQQSNEAAGPSHDYVITNLDNLP